MVKILEIFWKIIPHLSYIIDQESRRLMENFLRYNYFLPQVSVNTQTQTYAQIYNHAQIPANVQSPTLFQPHVLSQPSTHLCRNQAPCPATISTDPPSSAETPLITRRLSIISVDGNGAAPATFPAHTPQQPEDNYVGRTILYHQFL